MPTLNIQIEVPSAPAKTLEELTCKIKAYAQTLTQRMAKAKTQSTKAGTLKPINELPPIIQELVGAVPPSCDYGLDGELTRTIND